MTYDTKLFFITYGDPALGDEFDWFVRAVTHEHAAQLWLKEVEPYGIKGFLHPKENGTIQVFPVPETEGEHGAIQWPHKDKKTFALAP